MNSEFAPKDKLQASVAAVVTQTAELQARAAAAEKLAADWEVEAERNSARLELVEQQLTKALAERDHFMRYATELSTRVNGAILTLQSVMIESAFKAEQVNEHDDQDTGERANRLDPKGGGQRGEADRPVHNASIGGGRNREGNTNGADRVHEEADK